MAIRMHLNYQIILGESFICITLVKKKENGKS